MIIGLTGNDGSGKTTIANNIAKYFYVQSKAVIQPGEFDYFSVMKLFKKVIPNTTINKHQKVLQDKQRPTFAKKILPYVIYIDLLSEYIYRSFFQRGKIIIKDRTQYDFLATWREQRVDSKILTYLYTKLPIPDLHFSIDTEPEIAYKRRVAQNSKQEKEESFYVEKYCIYQHILKYVDNKIIINNNSALKHAISSIIKSITLRNRISEMHTIAISGLDGAGKTTTINNLTKKLDELNIKYKVVHFYYNYSFLKIKRWFKKDKVISEQESHKKSLETEKKAKKKGKLKWWKWFVLIDAYSQYFLVKIFYRNRLIIFDRFFPDYLVSFDFLGVQYNEDKMQKFFPKVDKYFLQIADYKILHNRKPEHTMSFFKKCHADYIKIAKKYDMILLNSGKYNENEIIDQLLKHV